MSELPRGWAWERLTDLGVDVRGSVRPVSGVTYELYSVPTYPTHRPEIIRGESVGSTKRPVEPGDVLLCKINPRINRVWVVGSPSGVGPQIASPEYLVFRAPDPRLSAYLSWYFRGPVFRRWIELSVEGATGSHTRAKSGPIMEQLVPIPPSGEQERIINTIEELLSGVDAAEASLSSAGERLIAFKQRLIDTAVEGKSVVLADLLTEPLRNGLSAPASSRGSIRVVTLTTVTQSAFVDAHTKLIEPGVRSVADLWMVPGDIFIQRSNTPELVGTAALYNGPRHWAIFPDLLIRVRVDEARADPSYVELVLHSTTLRRYFRRSAQGIAGSMPKISQPIIEAARIALPQLGRQKAIVQRLSDDLTVARRMMIEAERSTSRTRLLRRSILAAAFSGKLVPQDPDDEPASALLQRIRAVAAAPTPRTRRRMAGR